MPNLHPEKKLYIVGTGIVAAHEVYQALLEAEAKSEKLRVTMFTEDNTPIDSTSAKIVPSLTDNEALAVVPPGPELVKKLKVKFNQPGGIRVDDVKDVFNKPAQKFVKAVQEYSKHPAGHKAHTDALLEMGHASMQMWDDMYTQADPELKQIFHAANYNPCREMPESKELTLHQGYRVDLIFNVDDADARANNMLGTYKSLGYKQCKTLSPREVLDLDPQLFEFCDANSNITSLFSDGNTWNKGAAAIWRPGGCLDTSIFLPKFYEYLTNRMGTYTNEQGIIKNCFRIKTNRKVTDLHYKKESFSFKNIIKKIFAPQEANQLTVDGLKFASSDKIKFNKYNYQETEYVLCPGSSVGTLHKLKLAEPEYAAFAGSVLKLTIPVPSEEQYEFNDLNHCMEVHSEGVVLAWQARYENGNVLISMGGTKAFYGDKSPKLNEEFSSDRSLLQLNMANAVLPHCVKLATGLWKSELTQADLKILEEKNVAKRWTGNRSLTKDNLPTFGALFHKGKQIANGRVNTHHGSGGVSNAPAAVFFSRKGFLPNLSQETNANLREFTRSNRK